MKRLIARARSAAILLILGAGVCGPARGGGIEPFLLRWAMAPVGKIVESASLTPFIAWDETEAARGRARVIVLREDGVAWESLEQQVIDSDPACSWEGTTGDFAQVVVDADAIEKIAALDDVRYISRPPRGVPLVESEGLEAMRVPAFRDKGWSGDEVRIAVLDLGFAGYRDLLGTELRGKVHVKSFFRDPGGNGDINGIPPEIHGTACAEIVRDIVPDAELYLVNVETPADLQAAVRWLIDENVSVISHSVGWYWGGLDGSGPIDDIVEEATSHGILWVNASGNEAIRHTWTHGTDTDGDGLVEFENDGGTEKIDFSWDTTHNDLQLFLLWDAWPTTPDVDFTIEIVDGTDQVVASSSPLVQGYAFQQVSWQQGLVSPPIGARIRVSRGSGTGNILHLFRIGQGHFMYRNRCGGLAHPPCAAEDRSLLAPADARSVLAAGAIDWTEPDSADSYTSHDNAAGKPELYGPVGVSTATYGQRNFRGTSAAAPHIAGAAALLASARIRGGVNDLLLDRRDIDFIFRNVAAPFPGGAGSWGIVRMPSGPLTTERLQSPRILGNPAWGVLHWVAGCSRIEVLDAGGRVIAHPDGDWLGLDDRGLPAPSGIYWLRCPGGGASRVVWLGGTGNAPSQ